MNSSDVQSPLKGQEEGPTPLNLLVVDDDRGVREALQQVANSCGFSTFVADSAEAAYRLLDTRTVDVLLLDLKLPGVHGLDALRHVKQRWPAIVIVVVTGYGTVASAVDAMTSGAYDFVTKPFSAQDLKLVLQRAIELLHLKTENRILRDKMKPKQGFANMVGGSAEMEKLYRIIARAATRSHPVLICGKPGSGKEIAARSIHSSGPLREKPFVAIDCGSLNPSLLETELFGYVKGAFAGAHQARQGLLSISNGGTVFFDEISELPIDLQAKLLRAIDKNEVCQIGSTKATTFDVRILAATSCDLEQLVCQGTFRRDLFFKLNVLSIRIPSLADRGEDIFLLVAHFLERISRSGGNDRNLGEDALRLLLKYNWPGNVRELENCIERACAQTCGSTIHACDLPPTINFLSASTSAESNTQDVISMTELERQTILNTVERLNGDKLLAARLLGIGKTTLYRKLKEYRTDSSDYRKQISI